MIGSAYWRQAKNIEALRISWEIKKNTVVTATAEYRTCVFFEEKLIANDKMDEDEVDDLLAEVSVFKIKLGCLLNLLDDEFQVNDNANFSILF